MRELKPELGRAEAQSRQARNKGEMNRPFIGQSVRQVILRGIRLAPMPPLYGLVVWAIHDYEGLRQFLSSVNSIEVSQAVLTLAVAGFIVGAFTPMFIVAAAPKLSTNSSMTDESEQQNGEEWYWDKRSEGRELAIQEAINTRCSPNADSRWSMGDLIKEFDYPESKAGSDLLDGKVMRLLGIQSLSLKPTQKLEDAKRLLSLRYQGLASKYEWDVEIERLASGYKAFISVRAPAKNPEMGSGPWRLCLVADGASAALAVTLAAITRETWTFSTRA
ncbi:hypothetical protein [Pseudomonas sp. 2FG]|uniref:hypothetical protein n=1 Tax=Pseudomonas sp. 2FG TaxID=2502191 RepID=UPI0010F6637C|nr:hypothetical protein [Pseudomonas sp. 2FG]